MNKRGRPPKITQSQKEWAKKEFLNGASDADIAKELDCSERNVRYWIQNGKWREILEGRKKNVEFVEQQIGRLSKKKKLSYKETCNLAMLTNSLSTLLRRNEPKQKKPVPKTENIVDQELLTHMLSDDYGLYSYQKEFLLDESRFIKVLKARQIGYSYGCLAPKAILRASAGREQLIVSASEFQAKRVLGYVSQHLEKLRIIPEKESDKFIELPSGASIWALPTNFRTIQGNPGDVILDEFAWYHRQKRIWEAIVPSITQVGGTITVCSTPFVPGNFFWELMTEYKGKWKNFNSYRVTIQDAVEQGMRLPGGLDELRSLFDSDSWAMLYECEWAEDGSALLSWDLLHSIATSTETRFWDGPIWAGVDVGRTNDRFAIAIVGKEKEHYRLLHLELKKNIPFAQQKILIENVFSKYHVKRMNIDKTGLGMQLAEEIVNAHPNFAFGKHFSRKLKERLALNLLKLCEQKKLRIYNDTQLLTQLHSIKKKATQTGITYDAERDETGHADGFWAVALAVDELSKGEEPIHIEVW